jgi:sporulation protein YlmC with PRC-barrel domain
MKNNPSIAALTLLAALCATGLAQAQVAGASTSANLSIIETTQVATGWSVKKTLLGKTVYNDAGQKVGTVEDLIISPDRNVSYVIVGAGGFVGMGRHDVAVPVAQVRDESGKLVIPGATKDMVKAMPAFDYAYDTTQRDKFVASAEQDIAKGKTRVADLEKKTDALSTEAKGKVDQQLTALRGDVKVAETKLGELKQATANRWKEFEAGVSAATARLRKAVDVATG